MSSARLASRRPIFRCLNAPRLPKQQLRHASSQQLPNSRLEADAILGIKRQPRGPPTIEEVSVHRAEELRRAYYARRRNWLALGAALSMLAPILLVRYWPMPEEVKKEVEGAGRTVEEKGKDIMEMITPKPTKCDAPRSADDVFQGKKVVVAPGDKIIAAPTDNAHPTPSDPDTIELVETGTSYVPYFPKTIKLPSSSAAASPVPTDSEYTLLGLGIRRVSFLKVQVYVVGLYVKTSSLNALQNHLINTVNPKASALIPGEKDDLRQALLDPERSNEIWEAILGKQGADGVEMALRIAPVRNTDFNHLRDGLMRGIQGRTSAVERKHAEMRRQQAADTQTIAYPKPVEEHEYADEAFGLAMKEFKAIFGGRGNAPKGSVLFMTRDKKGKMDVLYQNLYRDQPLKNTKGGSKMTEPQLIGSVNDGRVSKLLWLLYLGGNNVSSPDARENIVDGCVKMVERPVGTMESMVQ